MGAVIDGFEIDVSRVEEPRLSSEITEFPVEDGIGVTDHVRNLPTELTIEGVVSDTPIGPIANIRSVLGSVALLALPSEEFQARLEEIHEKRQPITVETSRRIYTNMVLRDLTMPHDAATGDALVFTAVFREVKLVSNNRVEINVDIPRAKRKKNLGAKAPVPVPQNAPFALFPGINQGSPEVFPGLAGVGAFEGGGPTGGV